jgi:hypothetical protein
MATTTTKNAAGASADPALTTGPTAEDTKTEKEKATKADPVGKALSGAAATILDIQPGDPYPYGNPNPAPVERVAHNAEKPEWYEPIPPVARKE